MLLRGCNIWSKTEEMVSIKTKNQISRNRVQVDKERGTIQLETCSLSRPKEVIRKYNHHKKELNSDLFIIIDKLTVSYKNYK